MAGWFPPVHPGRPDLMGRRRVVQTRSADFIHWTEPVLVSSPDDASGQAVSVDNLDIAHYGMQQFRVGRLHFATLGVLRFVDNEMDVRLLYSRDGRTFITDEGNLILDCHFPGLSNPQEIAQLIRAQPGVVEHGLFLGMATEAVVAGARGVVVYER